MPKQKRFEHWFHAGMVERGSRYEWREAYSHVPKPGIMQYPWCTRREAQRMSRSRGAQAVFHGTRAAADAAVQKQLNDQTR